MVLEVFQNKWVRAVGLLGAIIVVSAVLYLLSAVLVPLFFAFIVAYVFDPVIDKIETYKIKGRHISRVGAIVTLVGGIVLASMLLPLFVFSSVMEQATEMMEPARRQAADADNMEQPGEPLEGAAKVVAPAPTPELPAPTAGDGATGVTEVNGTEVGERITDLFDGPTRSEEDKVAASQFQKVVAAKLEKWLALDSLVRVMKLAGPEVEDPDAMALLRQKIGETVTEDAGAIFKSLFPQFKDAGSSLIRLLGLIGDTFLRSFLFIGNFVLFAFVAIYLLKDYDHIVAACDDLVPHRYRKKTRRIMSSIDRQLRSFLRGQVTVCFCLGAMYAIGFLIAGAPFALLLAFLGALGSFVPYLGLILTIGPAVILTMLHYGPVNWHVGAVLATFVISQFLEGNFLTPRIVGSQVGLGPVWVILAIMVFGSTLGFAGLLLAVPIAATLKVILGELLENYRASDFFSGIDDDGDGPDSETEGEKGSKGRKTGPTASSAGKGRRLKKV
ncbi:MAG: AI-2E family transporter [Candidatus Hydrogenedentes bacterium]|nr:AI-2E family transporter [Candidatus Hydrogenedentota bacterium]